nr:MAG TPA: DNA helix destabilizing protein [Caudoviricetes sp.]
MNNNNMHKKQKPIITAVGQVYYPKIFTPGEYNGQSTGYTVDVVFDDPQAEATLTQLAEACLDEAKAAPEWKGKKWSRPFYPYSETEADDPVFKGKTKWRFKKNAEYTDRLTGETKQTLPPAVFDIKGNPVTDKDLIIGNGSLVRIAFIPRPYYASPTVHGVRFEMSAVQLVEVKPWERDAASYGFNVVGADADGGEDLSAYTSSPYEIDGTGTTEMDGDF